MVSGIHALLPGLVPSYVRFLEPETTRSWVSFEWALPGVVVGVIVPFSVSIGNALEFFISDVIVGVSVWSKSVDTLLTRDSVRWLVDKDSVGLRGNKSDDGS